MSTATVRIPGYKIQRLLAEGGMASVYLAVQKSLGRYVVLKLLRQFDNPAESERFLNEGRIVASLNHRNIISIHDIGLVGERHFICMEYLEKGDLEQRIREGMTVDQALDLLEVIGNCLDFVHRKGIVHRDIKPANILFHKDGTPILTDFGVAKLLEIDSSLTMDGTALGSPHYLSPEQAGCKPLDGRADIYGLGVIFYEMVVGRKPYGGDSPIEIIMAHLTEPVPVLPKPLHRYQDLLNHMMAKERDQRFGSAAEMVDYIRRLRRAKIPWPVTEWARRAARRIAGLFGFEHAPLPVIATTLALTLVPLSVMAGIVWDDWWQGRAQVERVAAAAEAAARAEALRQQQQAAARERARRERAAALERARRQQEVARELARRREAEARRAEAQARAEEQARQAAQLARQQQLADHLEQARLALREHRLTIPEGDNARHHFEQALALDPDNREAQRGLARVADRYAALAEAALGRAEYAKAQRFVQRGLAVQPRHAQLRDLEPRAVPPPPRPEPAPVEVVAQQPAPPVARAAPAKTGPARFLDRLKAIFR